MLAAVIEAVSCCIADMPDGIDRYLVLRCQLRELIIQGVNHIQHGHAPIMQGCDDGIDPMRMPACNDRHFGNNKVIQHGTHFWRISGEL